MSIRTVAFAALVALMVYALLEVEKRKQIREESALAQQTQQSVCDTFIEFGYINPDEKVECYGNRIYVSDKTHELIEQNVRALYQAVKYELTSEEFLADKQDRGITDITLYEAIALGHDDYFVEEENINQRATYRVRSDTIYVNLNTEYPEDSGVWVGETLDFQEIPEFVRHKLRTTVYLSGFMLGSLEDFCNFSPCSGTVSYVLQDTGTGTRAFLTDVEISDFNIEELREDLLGILSFNRLSQNDMGMFEPSARNGMEEFYSDTEVLKRIRHFTKGLHEFMQ